MPTPAFDEAFEKVSKLAATFQANEARYLSSDYQEAEARKDFIDKQVAQTSVVEVCGFSCRHVNGRVF